MFACVYKIYSLNPNISQFYIGSTKNFYMRRRKHEEDSAKSNSKLYKFIRENGGWDSFHMEILEKYNLSAAVILHESDYIKQLNPELNTNSVGVNRDYPCSHGKKRRDRCLKCKFLGIKTEHCEHNKLKFNCLICTPKKKLKLEES